MVLHATISTLGRLRQENKPGLCKITTHKAKAMTESKKTRRNLSKGKKNTQPIKGLTPTKENAGTWYPMSPLNHI